MPVFRFDTVDSTNEMAKRLIAEGRIRQKACVLAREQTAGKGTHGRAWVSPRDAGIYLSVIETHAEGSHAANETLTPCVGTACAETLTSMTGVSIARRSVNDLFIGDHKLGGILAESVFSGGQLTALIVGVGINVHQAPRPTPHDAPDAISLEDVMPASSFELMSVESLVEALSETIQRCILDASGVGHTPRR